jgi:AP-4 complex subunit beta-1
MTVSTPFDRVSNLVEYVLDPLRSGLSDRSPYVRQTAVMGCVKLYYLDQSYITGRCSYVC